MERREHDHILKTIEETIKVTVNGKIDGLRKDVETHSQTLKQYIDSSLDWRCTIEKSLDELKPVNSGIRWFQDAKTGASWLSGFLAPWAIIIGCLWAIVSFIRGT
jgi:hypothetical protein